jgi:hypothetical protein
VSTAAGFVLLEAKKEIDAGLMKLSRAESDITAASCGRLKRMIIRFIESLSFRENSGCLSWWFYRCPRLLKSF